MSESKPVGKIIGNRYKIVSLIGQGGMADIYLAVDLTLERRVAIKILHEEFSQSEDFNTQFLYEAKAAANLSHANIVTVYDFGLDNDRPFLVMEYIEGANLKALIQEKGRLSTHEALPLIIQACAGIGYAHRAGLVHCDIKPHNLIITRDRRLKVTDFGIARALSSINPEEFHEVVWGSPIYFSPEQAAGQAPSPASDVYSLGVVLYETLTGQPPFVSDEVTQLSEMHIGQPPLPPRYLLPDLPQPLEKIILKVLSKEPASRYRNGDQFGRVLQTFCKQNGIATPNSIYSDGSASPNESESAFSSMDWGTVAFAFLALLFVGGLVPFWFYLILRYGNFFTQ